MVPWWPATRLLLAVASGDGTGTDTETPRHGWSTWRRDIAVTSEHCVVLDISCLYKRRRHGRTTPINYDTNLASRDRQVRVNANDDDQWRHFTSDVTDKWPQRTTPHCRRIVHILHVHSLTAAAIFPPCHTPVRINHFLDKSLCIYTPTEYM